MNIIREFMACMFKYEEEEEFESMKKLNEHSCLKFIYDSKEKWAYYFMRDVFTLGIYSTQTSESINSTLKKYLNCNLDIN
jgi:hypothetical protein